MYVIRNHQRYRRTDGRTDAKRSHDRYIAKACSGKNLASFDCRKKQRRRSVIKVEGGRKSQFCDKQLQISDRGDYGCSKFQFCNKVPQNGGETPDE